VLAAIRSAGGRAAAVEADLSDPDTPARRFERAEAEVGPVDILVNNATIWVADTSGGRLGFPVEVSYGAAEAALENYTMSAAFELAPFGVTANAVYLR
jgi:NAD(P)-dependent dehydrogenase (short-subunit alcohol dehydrogenase family)